MSRTRNTAGFCYSIPILSDNIPLRYHNTQVTFIRHHGKGMGKLQKLFLTHDTSRVSVFIHRAIKAC